MVTTSSHETSATRNLSNAIVPVALSVVFLVSGIAEASDMEHFRALLVADSFATYSLALYFAPAVTVAETVAAFAPRFRRAGLYLSLALCCSFFGYSLLKTIVAPDVPCSCLGTLFAVRPAIMLVIDTALIALTAFGLAQSAVNASVSERNLSHA